MADWKWFRLSSRQENMSESSVNACELLGTVSAGAKTHFRMGFPRGYISAVVAVLSWSESRVSSASESVSPSEVRSDVLKI